MANATGRVIKDVTDVLLVLSCFWLAVVVWFAWRAWRQRSALSPVRQRHLPRHAPRPRVCIIVPARNEEHNVGPCLNSLLAQTIAGENLHINVVDDDSTDRTASIISEISASAGDAHVSSLTGQELPPGWNGKVHACWRGYLSAPDEADWICFLDADMRAQPALIESAVLACQRERIDLLSLAPKHDLRSFAERLIIPCGYYLIAFSQKLSSVQSPQSEEVAVTGQFMLFRRTAYEAVGGHASVPLAICEDTAIARLVKRRGFRVMMQDGSKLLTARMYTGWKSLWPGFAKNLIDMLGGAVPTAIYAAAAISLSIAALVLPVASVAACAGGSMDGCRAVAPALAASAIAVAFHLFGAAHFDIPWLYGFLFPIGYSAGALIALDSLRWRLTGRVRWKGRVYS